MPQVLETVASAARLGADHPIAWLNWLDTHNGTITAGATAALAILTAVLVILNRRLLKESAAATAAATKAASATEKAASSAHEQALATEKAAAAAQMAVELDYRPAVVVIKTYGGGNPPDRVELANFGRGPALNVHYLSRMSAEWQQGNPGHELEWRHASSPVIAAGQSPPAFAVNWGMNEVADAVWQGATGVIRQVVCCQDQAGNRYRYMPPNPMPEIWHVREAKNAWVEWYEALVD
jgi:hypothetical protein